MHRPSKATAQTTCQKCLKKGHYSYECRAKTQERPYVARPSRTQQLLDPELRPKLTNDVLKVDQVMGDDSSNERGRKRAADQDMLTDDERPRKRSRSCSRSSTRSSSVATISTRSSSSASRRRRRLAVPNLDESVPATGRDRKRRRASSMSSGSDAGYRGPDVDRYKNTRHRIASQSPRERGRSKDRQHDEAVNGSRSDGPERRQDPHRDQQRGAATARTTARRSPSPYSKRIALTQGDAQT